MSLVHQIPVAMTQRAWSVAVVGAGGTGSALLPNLARLHHAMLELGHPGGIDCTVYDDDTVSETNVGRQGFYPVDVGQYKATLLVNRLNILMGTRWEAETRRVGSKDRFTCDMVIGCVDTRAARKAILGAMQRGGGGYYFDCGNESNSGQVILGQVRGKAAERLPHVGDLFPELLNPKGDKADTAPSCSMADALRKQSLVINQAIAVQAYNLLWTLFRTGTLQYCGAFVNLAAGRTNPLPVDPVAWERFGYKLPAKASRKRAPAK
ncbi:PRTRC system ThiF family protein [Cupriavidus pinatubonensis]|uniref:PRTRC system ThiF family protein n=1 Tax=Cupriavidus pinatubonensis TaxID=248026 RepID=UPI00112A2453|nr:PRTRC system ThiF family protein [Cupriavidus pinatubonensis]TPQ30632.1 thiamine biosynthesis protein ThiF [Cupriavidus pinatubonensis]